MVKQIRSSRQTEDRVIRVHRTYQMRRVRTRSRRRRLALQVPISGECFDPPVVERSDVTGDDRSVVQAQGPASHPAEFSRSRALLFRRAGESFLPDSHRATTRAEIDIWSCRLRPPIERRFVISDDPGRQQPVTSGVASESLEYGFTEALFERTGHRSRRFRRAG